MKSTTLLMAVLSGMALASPFQKRQDLSDVIDAYEDTPDVEPSAPAMGTSAPTSTVVYDQDAAIASATDAAATGTSKVKRDGCVVNLVSNYVGSVSPDTDTAFLSDPTIASIANNAVAPAGYFLVDGYKNLQASASAPSYLTFIESDLHSYDVNYCAAKCNSIQGCNSFVIYFERDNQYISDLTDCPASATTSSIMIKCAFYGIPVTAQEAQNAGQWTNAGFHIVIAGANAYTTAPQPQAGFNGPNNVNNASINAPPNTNTYMGVQTFPANQPYDPAVCAAGCQAKTAYNSRHPNADGTYRKCVFFDAYILLQDGTNGQFTCTYYTDAYDSTWATNFGQTRSGHTYTVTSSNTYKLAGFPWAPSRV